MKFTVDRSTWVAGKPSCITPTKPTLNTSCGKGSTALLNGRGFKCCLGHICKQFGIEDDRLLNVGIPYTSSIEAPIFPEYILPPEMTFDAVIINDNEFTTLVDKESCLKQLFLDNGHEIEFVGEYAK